ncbi:FAD/NAD(P)-binding domain-containing protein [Punctularia strigosozonata HHB-11173 SS5]|uniref:FAD/NAD(P)-binding domain-containing protein n=1 Tax=Punctularia strigosozonata (strain HHB-11173) TaxID=741275 RepID=UPI0004416DFE|nr:FAD/NAD(P)-binding domain-containing protein [Punctularia strigosozonata HHB-11173 SS5]EIN05952.1 FAD/NAD(P)-binding domain-containing protein [Punctularia strigosozonata HHB-11173 SS5]
MSTSRTASLRLDFLVIGGGEFLLFFLFFFWPAFSASAPFQCGGFPQIWVFFAALTHVLYPGISGLAAAFALARAGHRVRVLEKSETGLGRKAGGVRVPPNLSKILVEWGLEDELSQSTIRCKGSTFNSLETGETIGYLEWNEDVMKETGGSFLLMHHEDLHRMLHRLATAAGAQVEFGKGVRAVHAPPEGQGQQPSVELESGEAVSADIIIGADGYRSIVRPVVLGEEDQGEDVGMSVYTATIPMSAMMEDPDLRHFAEAPEWPMWMGDGRSILGAISEQRPGQVYNVHLFWPDSGSDAEEGWDQEVPMDMDFGAYDLRIQKLMKLVPSAIRTKVVNREMIEEWVDESGRIVLIGDAAHPTLPGSTHGCSLALEDAAVFGTLFSRLKNWDQVPQLLEAYQDLRQLRCTAVNQREVANKELVQIPPGPMRHNRDEEMRKAMQSGHDHWDESKLKKQWDEIAEVFAYNAFDASDDWYVSWGAIMEASRARAACDDLSVQVEIADAPAAP